MIKYGNRIDGYEFKAEIEAFWEVLAKECRPDGRLGRHYSIISHEVQRYGVSTLNDAFYRDTHVRDTTNSEYVCVSQLIGSDLVSLFNITMPDISLQHHESLLEFINELLDSCDNGEVSLPEHVYVTYNTLSQLFEISCVINYTVAHVYALSKGLDELASAIYVMANHEAQCLMDIVNGYP